MVAQALRSCGLYLGDESALIGPDENNPAGYWEHRDIVQLNDRILARLGGSWESPPAHPVSWPDYERLSDLRNEARSVLDGEFAGAEHWGWKDPRNSLTLPFWLELEPDLLVVMCVRNPLEVAESLDRRGSYTRAFSLRLWQLYTERLLAAAPPRRTIVTHYNAWFADPSGEAARVARFLGLAPDEASLDAVASLVKPSLRNHLATTAELEEVWPSGYLVDIYRELCRVESNAELMAPAKSEEAA